MSDQQAYKIVLRQTLMYIDIYIYNLYLLPYWCR